MMDRNLIVVNPALEERHRAAILSAARAHGFAVRFFKDPEEAMPFLSEAEIIFGQSDALAKNAPRVRWLCTPSAGVDQFAGLLSNALLTNSSGAYGTTIAEHIVMVALELMRRQQEYSAIVARRDWVRTLPVRSIRASRVTLLGTGDIGQEAAIRLRAFSPASLTGINRRGRNPGGLFDRVLTQDRLEEALPQTDLLIASLPGTRETAGILSAARLAMLPRDAFFINVGRGGSVDQAGLERLLRAGHLAGAALDVFETEPLPKDSTLWECPRLLITPHTAGNMTLAYTVDQIVSLFLEDLDNYCAGRPLKRLVDRGLGY